MADNKDMSQGALFVNQRKTETRHPDFRGELTLSKSLLRELVDNVKSGKEAKLSLACWKKISKAGNEYQSMSAQLYVEYKPQPKDDDDEIPF